MLENHSHPVIIKKIKKTHAGHHGGAWKVAYADFVTAMMALFLVLWLVAMLSIDSKKTIAEYFRSYTVFKGQEAGGATGVSTFKGGPVKLDPDDGGIKSPDKKLELITVKLNKVVTEKLNQFREQILIFTTRDGVRLELTDKGQSPMFEAGKAKLAPNGEEVLATLAAVLSEFPNSVTIEGHTDSSNYNVNGYTNWELAADRANSARRELIKNGFEESRITRVTSFASAEQAREHTGRAEVAWGWRP